MPWSLKYKGISLKKVMVTGATGFIGSSIIGQLAGSFHVVALFNRNASFEFGDIISDRFEISDPSDISRVANKYAPDIIIHCAGIAHQKVGSLDRETYFAVNSDATENLARCAVNVNPDVRFIFLSSVSVYGERQILPQLGSDNHLRDVGFNEESYCCPSGDYAESKLVAERRLLSLQEKGILKYLDILRLSPVYDREWSFNLDRRVFAPRKMTYLRFGSGKQRMSALARPNLVGFIKYLLDNSASQGIRIFNVCDTESYSFSSIIEIFKTSGVHPARPTVLVPKKLVWMGTRIAGMIFPKNRDWWHACYDKLTGELVYDNKRMLDTGFRPPYSLATILSKR